MKQMTRTAFAALISALFCGPAAHAHDSGVIVQEAWTRATPPGAVSGAVFGEIYSTYREEGDSLIGAESPLAERAELYTQVEEDGVMKMTRVEKIDIPEGDTVMLSPAGLHVMLFGLKQPFEEGAEIPFTFIFQHADKIEFMAKVRPAGAKGPHDMHEAHDMHDEHKSGGLSAWVHSLWERFFPH